VPVEPVQHSRGWLAVSFLGATEREVPEAQMHLRCKTHPSCQMFVGPPAQGLEPLDTAKLTITREGGEQCFGGECRMLARCPAIAWTGEEKASGFAEAWEKKVLGRECASW
jgi:hypothetical protein